MISSSSLGTAGFGGVMHKPAPFFASFPENSQDFALTKAFVLTVMAEPFPVVTLEVNLQFSKAKLPQEAMRATAVQPLKFTFSILVVRFESANFEEALVLKTVGAASSALPLIVSLHLSAPSVVS